jgi:hypothetical protein
LSAPRLPPGKDVKESTADYSQRQVLRQSRLAKR